MKLFENFWYAFLKLDAFGKKPKFTIARQKTFQTEIGTTMTLIAYGFICYFVWYFGKEIFLRHLPAVVTTTTYDDMPYPINLSNKRFELALSLQDDDFSPFINESIYTAKAFLVTYKRDNGAIDINKKEVPLTNCSQHTFSMLNDYYKTLPLNNLYCLTYDYNIILRGEFDRPEWTYLSFDFMQCDNKTKEKPNCVPIEESNRLLTGGYLGLFLIDLSISPNDYINPDKYFGKNIFTAFSVKDFREVWLYLKTIEINTDVGILFNDIETESYYSYENIRESMYYKGSNSFLSLKIRASPIRTIIDRSYMKVQTLCAYVGGIIKFILLVGEIMVYWFREILYKDYILNFYSSDKRTYKMCVNNNNNNSNSYNNNNKASSFVLNKKNDKSIAVNLLQVVKGNSMVGKQTNEQSFSLFVPGGNNNNIATKNLVPFRNPDGSVNENTKNNIERINEMQKNTKLSLQDILGPCLCDKSKRRKIATLEYRYKNISINFDIITYLKALNEVFMIKTQLLNQSQMKLSEIGYFFEFGTSLDIPMFDYVSRRFCKNNNISAYTKLQDCYYKEYEALSKDKDTNILNRIICNSVSCMKI